MNAALLVVTAALIVQSSVFAGSLPQEPSQKDATMPVVLREVKPNYPESVKKEGIHGIVTLSAVVKKDGTVGDVTVKKSLHPELDAEAVKAMKQWRFRPGTREGKPVDVAVDVEISFTVDSGGTRPADPSTEECEYQWNDEPQSWEMSWCPSPIIMPIGSDKREIKQNYRLTDAAHGVLFDLNGDGRLELVAWMGARIEARVSRSGS